MEEIRQIDDQFTTADAEDVTFAFDGSNLVLRFRDWKSHYHEVLFPDPILIIWGADIPDARFRYDCPHEIVNSKKLSSVQDNTTARHHYLVCFNASSNLEVISGVLSVKNKT